MEANRDKEERVLELLEKFGTLTPSEISVKTYLLPDEVEEILKDLRERGLVQSLSLKEQAQALEQEACTLTPEGRRTLRAKAR
jgi:DNA-binding MarR family transcriptional regulator